MSQDSDIDKVERAKELRDEIRDELMVLDDNEAEYGRQFHDYLDTAQASLDVAVKLADTNK